MDFIIDQLIGLFDAHFRSGIHFTADQLVGLLDAHHQPIGYIHPVRLILSAMIQYFSLTIKQHQSAYKSQK